MALPPDRTPPTDRRTVHLRAGDARAAGTDFTVEAELADSFADYELLAEIGSGGMGRVYKARQKSLDRVVALKTILSREIATATVVQRFRKEAEAAGRLDHPGIVPVYESGEHEGQLYFTMALVEGQGLDERLRQGPLDGRQAALVVQRVAEAVGYAHRQGVIHRDLKPANVLLGHDGAVKVTDFGIARRLNAPPDTAPEPELQSAHPKIVGTLLKLTQAGTVIGTPGYMAPEQALAKDQVGPPADIWALGAVLYACLTGRAPFLGADPFEALTLTVEAEPVSPAELNPDADHDLVEICLKCMRKDPAERFASAEALAGALAQWREGREEAPSAWAARGKRLRRFMAGAPELLPLAAGLIVHRLTCVQDGLFVGCALLGLGLASRPVAAARFIPPAIANAFFLLTFAIGWLIPGRPAEAVGGLVSAAGVLAAVVTLACGLVNLDAPQPTGWSAARVGGVFLAVAVAGLAMAAALSLAGGRLHGADFAPGRLSALGRLAGWCLAVPLGLAVGSLLSRAGARTPALALLAALFVVLTAWGLRELHPTAVPEASRYALFGPGPALTVADDRSAHWLANSSAEARQVAAAGTFWLKFLLLAAPLGAGVLATGWLPQPRGR
ncbi:MAG: serine/threonine-protein kinase [Gemmataceae bacterium]